MQINRLFVFLIFLLLIFNSCDKKTNVEGLKISKNGYFEMPGLNVLVFNNSYTEGHQSGVEIIQHDNRVATCGDLRLEPSPGQWQPVPMLGEGFEKVGCSPQQVGLMSRKVDTLANEISLNCSYPNYEQKDKGFNPIIYPNLELKYNVIVKAEGSSFTITVNLDKPLPKEWVGKVGYNLEFFPGDLYGKTYAMDNIQGVFPRQANGPVYLNDKKEAEVVPLSEGNKLVIVPESDLQRITIESNTSKLQLLDGSMQHNNGWFVVRSLVPENATSKAIVWKISPNVIPNFIAKPVIHISQVGYHTNGKKTAYIELDKNDKNLQEVSIVKIQPDGKKVTVKKETPKEWENKYFLRYHYYSLDFSDIKEDGMYCVQYGESNTSSFFPINKTVYDRNVWQPTLEYFLPVQMCHMRINQKYRVWHGACHMDDALMAPLNIAHFDGYNNTKETSTLCAYKPLDHVPGLDVGGWHDAGDYDLRLESQAQTVLALALAYEEFGVDYDMTYIDQENHHVEIHQPDGKADILQQVEHGVLTILGGYKSMGILYRGIIEPTLRQYVHLGDGATHTDNKIFTNPEQKAKAAKIDGLWYKKVANRYSAVFDPELNLDMIEVNAPDLDDRLVFNDSDPVFQYEGIIALAAASRVLTKYNPKLAKECIETAETLYAKYKNADAKEQSFQKTHALIELIISTNKDIYKKDLIALSNTLNKGFKYIGWTYGRVLPFLNDPAFTKAAKDAATKSKASLDSMVNASPFGIPLKGAEYIGFRQYYLNKAWPDIYNTDNLFNALNFMFGCRPGNTTNSLISGVGANSPTITYAANRADWSYIPGATFWNAVNLISPDYAEDKVWPFLWQEREVIVTSPCYYMFSVFAAKKILEKQ